MAFLPELAHYGDRVTVVPQDEAGFLDLDGVAGHPAAGHAGLLLRPRGAALRGGGSARRGRPAACTWSGSRPSRREAPAGGERSLRAGPAAHRRDPHRAAGQVRLRRASRTPASTSSARARRASAAPASRRSSRATSTTATRFSDEKAANDAMMICVSRCLSDRLTLDL